MELRADITGAVEMCAHYWMIETPNGEMSEASCKYCGAKRSFANYSPARTMARSNKGQANGLKV